LKINPKSSILWSLFGP